MPKSTTDRWFKCLQGHHHHWGSEGAAGILFKHGSLYLLELRAPWVDQPGTWGTPGGAVAGHEYAIEAAWREAREEISGIPDGWMWRAETFTPTDCENWQYTLFVVEGKDRFEATAGQESVRVQWFTEDEVNRLPLHPGFRKFWESYALDSQSE